MKTRVLTIILVILASYGAVAQVNYITPPSNVDYLRTLNRYAVSNSIDAAIFNPAGLIGLDDGIHLHVGNQVSVTGLDLSGNNDIVTAGVWGLNPDISVAWKQAGYGLFFTANSHHMSYSVERAKPYTDDPTFNGTNITAITYDAKRLNYMLVMTYGGMIGIGDHFSSSAALRVLVNYQQNDFSINSVGNADPRELYVSRMYGVGLGGQAGVMFRVNWFRMAVNYISPSTILLKTAALTQQELTDGKWDDDKNKPSMGMGLSQEEEYSTLVFVPGEIRLGLEFDIVKKFIIQASFDMVFDKEHKYRYGGATGPEQWMFANNTGYTMKFGAGLEHIINPTVMWGAGVKMITGNDANSLQVGLGAGFGVGPNKMVKLKFAFMSPIDFANQIMDFNINLGVSVSFNHYKPATPF